MRSAALGAFSLALLGACGMQAADDGLGTVVAAASATTLGAADAQSGRCFGAAIGAPHLTDSADTTIASREFDQRSTHQEGWIDGRAPHLFPGRYHVRE